jgi:aromatic ring-opening dioxygenase catalytic subunit (LigB family)
MRRMTQPTFYIPHGGGPCFFMDDPHGKWTGMERFLRELPALLPEPPTAILIVSGHWETRGEVRATAAAQPALIYDYYGFPPHTYELTYPAPGSPALAEKAVALLQGAGINAATDADRGLDHGVFVPLKVSWPDADVPVVELSLEKSLDPAQAIAMGAALRPLRDEGVLILGAGMSFHNMRGYGDPRSTEPSQAFDAWLTASVESEATDRAEKLVRWADAPSGRFSHPREEHLLPLFVAAGASDRPGRRIYNELVLNTAISAYRFD